VFVKLLKRSLRQMPTVRHTVLWILLLCALRTLIELSTLCSAFVSTVRIPKGQRGIIASRRASGNAVAALRSRRPRRLEYAAGRYSKWLWLSHTDNATYAVNYIQKGPVGGEKVLLVHGFGASAYHWRNNILALAEAGFNVYAIDLLGFGRSDKPITQYSAALWQEQLVAFIEDVVGDSVRLVGNSLGGYAALKTASNRPDLVRGLALLNAAGPFRNDDAEERLRMQLMRGGESTLLALSSLVATGAPLPLDARMAIQRFLVSSAFLVIGSAPRVKEILKQVYPNNQTNVDDELVSSILVPSLHPNASEVYNRLMTRSPEQSFSDDDFADVLCDRLQRPLLLLWGNNDPWIKPEVADKMQEAYKGPDCKRVGLNAGHCPHDEVPDEVNAELIAWMTTLTTASS